MEWKNLAHDIYKEIKGEDEFDKKMKEADTIKPTHAFDGVKLSIEKAKIKLLFGAAALYTGKRPTHHRGAAARGIATVVSEPQFPECEFFTAGRSFPVILRHSSLKSEDDAMLDFLSASVKFADHDSNNDSALDILMSTGRGNALSDVQGIYDSLGAHRSGNLKDYYLDNPDRLASIIDGLRRAPDSFFGQRYYSEIILGFKALDSVKRYARFRLIPADGSLETGLLTEEQQQHIWDYERLPSETRPKDYLKQEFEERVSRGAVKYKLQITLHEVQSDDPPGILNIARHWDEASHDWLDVAHVTLTTLLSPNDAARLKYNPGTLPNPLYFLPARSVHDSSSVALIRKETYAFTQKIRSLRSSNLKPEHVTTYVIRVETAGQSRARCNANISISLTGFKGKTGNFRLLYYWDPIHSYTLQAMDVGEVLMIHLYNNGVSSCCNKSDWFVKTITVFSSKQGKTFEFLCNRWVERKIVVFQGRALLPFQDQPEVVKNERTLELQERKMKYPWGRLPDGVTDLPGFVQAKNTDDIPRDSQFSDKAAKGFKRGRLCGITNLGLSLLYTICDRWDNFESFKKIFTGWTGDVPQITRDDKWLEDRVFGQQFLNGCNPCVIERCNQLPSNFPVTDDLVQNILDRGMTLTEEIKERHVYIVDCKDLVGIKRGAGDSNSNYAADPLCLFYVNTAGDLVPIAIQLFQEPSSSNPIWTPNDVKFDWLLAKMWFRNADHQIHQMGEHLLKTHLVTEPFAVATWRQLSSLHPVFKLLFPHLRSVMAINTVGRNHLIAEGGIVDQTLSIGGGGHVQLMEKTYKEFNFEMLCLPDMLKKRGVDDPEKLPNYYYRDDGLRMWNAISNFIREVLGTFYYSDEDVCNDLELQAWVTDIHDNGLPVREGDVDHGFPTFLQTFEQLQHVLTCIVFTCSCQHAAVNFPQMEITGFIPNVPAVMRQPPPTQKDQANMQLIMDTLPNKIQAGWHVGTMYTLTRMAEDEQFIGDYSQSLLSGKGVEGAISHFQASLRNISEAIKKRNASVEFPYPYLLPEKVPNSIGI